MASRVDSPAAISRPFAIVSALVVERTLSEALSVVSMLAACQLHVTVAETFAKAKARLSERPPAVLVTEIRLAEYNGLHLVLRGKSLRPDMAALVTSSVPDSVLQADAEAMGATFVLKPVGEKDLAAAVFRTIFHSSHRGNPVGPPAGPILPIRPPFERRNIERRIAEAPIDPDRRGNERRRDLPSLLTHAAGMRS